MTEELFDLSMEYDAMLNQGLAISGESKSYFINGRLKDIRSQLRNQSSILRILDFGCGIGDATAAILDFFPEATEVIGTDLSLDALEFARKKHKSEKLKFIHLSELDMPEYFDFCYVNGVFHHIQPAQRPEAIRQILSSLRAGAFLALCENNPFNPGTQIIMNRIPFDRAAKKIPFYSCKKLILQAGFSRIISTRFLFYFPRFVAFLRPLESRLVNLPLGGQYYVLAQK
jgi:SAM-dependent methyltransferase